MQNSARTVLVVSFCVLVFLFLLHIGLGTSGWITPQQVLKELFIGPNPDSIVNSTVWNLRLVRATQGFLVGAILGVCGAALQTFFRNPLAEPYIVGSSSGAALGVAATKMVDLNFAFFGLLGPIAGFASGLGTLLFVMALSRRRGVIETPTMLLAGVVTSTMLASLLSFIVLYAGRDQGEVLRWLMGSLSEGFWPPVALMAIVLAIAFVVLYRLTPRINALSLGEEAAQSLGVNPKKLRWTVLICVTAMTSVTVGPVGIIGFVGLVAPHMARRVVGVDLRYTLPLSGIFGAILLVGADMVAQRGNQGAGYPVGIITAIVGAPVLLLLLRKRQS